MLKEESLSDEVKVGEEKPDVGVGPLAPLLRRPRYSSVPLSINPLMKLDVGKPMLSEAGSKGWGGEERLQFIIEVCLKGETGCDMSGNNDMGGAGSWHNVSCSCGLALLLSSWPTHKSPCAEPGMATPMGWDAWIS